MMEVEIADGRVGKVRPRRSGTAEGPHLLTPMFTDLQVNGGGGVMVNSDPTPEGLRAIAAAHRRLGTGWILPTVITDAPEVTEAAGDAALSCYGSDGILGLHIEGPHLAPRRRGTHPARHLRPLDRRTVDLVVRLRAAGMPVMITLAPELADATLLAELVASGAVVSAGHSCADAEEAARAFAAGVRCVTHLFNAMEPMTARAPGLLGAGIGAPVHCGIICDGLHVDWEMLRIALRARPGPGLSFAVSDAMGTVGGGDAFVLDEQTIRLQEGRLVNAEGALAGAHVDLRASLSNLVVHVGLPLAEALPMVTSVPRAALGLRPTGGIEGMKAGDLILLDENLRLTASVTIGEGLPS